MTILNVLHYPNPLLRKNAEPVAVFDASIKQLVADMFETMYEKNGVGLAAIQVGIAKQVIVIDVSENKDQPLCIINPEIISKEGMQLELEGCLSIPGYYEEIERAAKLRLKAFDKDGNVFEVDAEGLLAKCIQHEMDHLKGKLFLDHLSKLKQERAIRKIQKLKRRECA